MQTYITTLITTTLIQLGSVFGIVFVLGTLLTFVQSRTHQTYFRSIGWKGILWTAWIGTPIHELSHAIMAKLFRHKLFAVHLFQPQKTSGKLGHVDHGYNPKSLYQRMGNFFIGAAPLIGGSLFLLLCLKLLVPDVAFSSIELNATSLTTFTTSFFDTLKQIFTMEHIREWHFWLFLYLTFAVSSHIAPSPVDRKSMWGGFYWIVALLIIMNAILLLFHIDISSFIFKTAHYTGLISALFVYALVMSLVHLVFAMIVLWPFRKY